ncbi:MAG: MFS transporter, partial [Pseudolysinimonas sp.]
MVDPRHPRGSEISEEDRRIRAWRNSVYLVFAACGAAVAAIVARTPTIRDDLGITLAETGLLLLGMSMGSLIALITSGQIVWRLGPRTTIVWSLFLAASGLVTTGLGSTVAHNYVVVLIALICFGVGSGSCNVAMNVEGADVERATGRPTMPLFHASFSAGGVVGVAIAAAGAALHLGVVVDLSITAVLVAAGGRLVAPHLEASQRRTADVGPRINPLRAQLSVWLERRTILIGVLVLSTSFVAGAGNNWLSIAMVDGHATSNSVGALSYGAFSVAGTAGRLAAVSLLSRFGRVAVIRASAVVCGVGLILVIFFASPAVALLGAILWGLGCSLGFPIGMSAAADDAVLAGARISVVSTIGFAASLIGPPLIGTIGESVGILNALAVVLVFVAVGALVAGSARELAGRHAT